MLLILGCDAGFLVEPEQLAGGQPPADTVTEAVPQPQDPEAWLDVRFDGYGTIADLDEDRENWAWYEAKTGHHVEIDSDVAYPGLARSLRYDYRHDDPCSTQTNSRQVFLPEAAQEVWVEFAIRWSDNFSTTATPFDPATCNVAAGDHKTFFALTEKGNTGRWEIKIGAQGSVVMRAAGTNSAENDERYIGSPDPEDLWDAEWHIVRLHFRHSTGNTTRDGAMTGWIDGTKIYEETGINTVTDDGTTDRITGLRLGANQQKGPLGELMSIWWGYVKAYDTDPGWH